MEWVHGGLIFSGYHLQLMPALAWGAQFNLRTLCSLNASGHAVCSSAAIRSSPQLAILLLDFQYMISLHGQNKNYLKSFMRNSWLCFQQAALQATSAWQGRWKAVRETRSATLAWPPPSQVFLKSVSEELLFRAGKAAHVSAEAQHAEICSVQHSSCLSSQGHCGGRLSPLPPCFPGPETALPSSAWSLEPAPAPGRGYGLGPSSAQICS